MRSSRPVVLIVLSILLLAHPAARAAQQETPAAGASGSLASPELPDAPQPQSQSQSQYGSQSPASQSGPPATKNPAPATPPAATPDPASSGRPAQAAPPDGAQAEPAQTPQGPAGPSAGAGSPAAAGQEEERARAREQIREQTHRRMLGIMPTYNTTYHSDAVSMTPREKFYLAMRIATDPFTFSEAIVVAGINEGLDKDTGFGWGAGGYAKRAAAAYLDDLDGTILGNAVLPVILHQDPRFYRRGYGNKLHRLAWAILGSSVICRHDNSTRLEPNFSNVGGNILSGAISNLYYPGPATGIGHTITGGLTVTAEGTVSGIFNEFWPDISRRFLHQDPTHGLDAEAEARAGREREHRPPQRDSSQRDSY